MDTGSTPVGSTMILIFARGEENSTASTAIVRSDYLSVMFNPKYVVMSTVTGFVLDDNNGYGYNSPEEAQTSWDCKLKTKEKPYPTDEEETLVWMENNADFVEKMDACAYRMARKKQYKFDVPYVQKMLIEEGLSEEVSASELYRIWKHMQY